MFKKIFWPDLNLPPINLWSLPNMQYRSSIDDALMEEWDALAKNKEKSEKECCTECEEQESAPTALNTQVGGNHYKEMKIQPVEFITANNIPFIEGSIIKYVCRHASKNGKQDLEKAKHFIDLLIDLRYKNV